MVKCIAPLHSTLVTTRSKRVYVTAPLIISLYRMYACIMEWDHHRQQQHRIQFGCVVCFNSISLSDFYCGALQWSKHTSYLFIDCSWQKRESPHDDDDDEVADNGCQLWLSLLAWCSWKSVCKFAKYIMNGHIWWCFLSQMLMLNFMMLHHHMGRYVVGDGGSAECHGPKDNNTWCFYLLLWFIYFNMHS